MSRAAGRDVGNAIPGLVASLLPWGVTGAHWLPGPDGEPVLWLTTATQEQHLALERQGWLPAQVRILLMRYGVPHEDVSGVRVMFDSEQGIAALLDRA
ncbi:hypothetical protein [Nocardioides cynanchi]|uniref:hypothetical protein n=1 Tax=Nocardioides cynanchi TaxID=2558918 RepID=UPI001247A983|nr:hypothetical protein [Nocardioides cynanchi]